MIRHFQSETFLVDSLQTMQSVHFYVQGLNKVATAVQLRFDVTHSDSLAEEVKSRLVKLAGKRMTQEGVLVIEARRFRTQEKNQEDAIARFRALVQKALEKPKSRKKTKPTQASQEERLKEKKRRGEIKRTRAKQPFEQY
jgi:ribosome-associated protein